MNPKVSILIPSYNSTEFLYETVNSAINQKWSNKEIIIIDDGSTDNSYLIAKSFESKNIKVLKQKNQGACAARNFAFEICQGDYIQFLDADDLLSSLKIAHQIKFFEKYGDDLVVSCQWGRFNSDPEVAFFSQNFLDQDWNHPIEWLINSWEGKGMAQTSVWLTPRKLIEKAGPWDERLKVNQDGEFFSRVLLQAKAIKYCHNAKVYYRSTERESVSKILSKEKAESLLLSYRLYKKNTLQIEDSPNLRHALMMNFVSFIYQLNDKYPKLCDEARKEIMELGFKKLPPNGGKHFKRLSRIIGFENALKIRKITRGIK